MKNGYRYRCKKAGCRVRVTLRRRKEEYVREPCCKACGAELTLDQYRHKTEIGHGAKKCNCDGYHFPHRPGGGVWCWSHPTGPTDQDYLDRYGPGCLEDD